ncbi:hypothetical protein B4065_3049 [Caldibacillus thermoamylovorans]|nr:hypothetical protein B4065_3049 [Caldibacillus thermoamylovorans]
MPIFFQPVTLKNSSIQSIQWTYSFGKGKFKIGEMFYACKNINHDEKFRS